MAVTKIIAIRDRLDKRVNYVVNSEKTSLDAGVAYITNPEKTEQTFFTKTINCHTIETAYAEMMDTKRYWNKMGGVLGFHIIQSFVPGEVTPTQAHEIGMEFCKRLFKGRFQVVIGTHLDKKHLHNHIIVNSVSYMDGKKYHSNPESYYQEVQKISDDLCRENGLSIITPEGKGKHYGEWKAEQDGRPTVRGIIREDIDRIIGEAYTYQTFLLLLQRNGYPSIAVEAAGYKNSSWTVSAKRTYPNLNDADISLIPKTIEDSGRTLTLADVDWQEVPTGNMGDFVEAFRYTANATYTGTAYSKTATGYTVTVEYGGEVTKTSCDTIVYTAVFTATGATPSAENADAQNTAEDFNYALLLIPLGILALGGVGYGGYKGYKHYQNKKRGYE